MKLRRFQKKDCQEDMKEVHRIQRVIKWLALAIASGMICFLIGFIAYHWDTLIRIIMSQNPSIELQEFISGFGIWGAAILILFQSLQIVIAFLPGEPIELVSGMMYGGFLGAILCLIGVLIGTYAVFYAVQKLGNGLITAFHDEKKVKKFNRLAVFRYQKNAELLTFILFLIPGLPKDFFTFLAPLTPISIHRFVLISTLGRAPGMLITTYAGVSLLQGNFLLAACLYGLLGICALIGILYYRKLLKSEQNSSQNES
ncbi:MAG: TVP38/TMEM64 family protein [Candidatus Merdivicinus sp.]|jgi:uncharacterized membrane protein YdjX (TVP38/TMEM64 family)